VPGGDGRAGHLRAHRTAPTGARRLAEKPLRWRRTRNSLRPLPRYLPTRDDAPAALSAARRAKKRPLLAEAGAVGRIKGGLFKWYAPECAFCGVTKSTFRGNVGMPGAAERSL
jgi:hypothetical protein